MSRNQIQQDLQVLFVSRLKQPYQVVVRAVALSYLVVVAHVVARVHKRRVVNGIQPYRVAAEPLNIVELFDDSVDVADPVAVGVVKALRINFIKYCVVEPFRHKVHTPLSKIFSV